MYPPNNMWHEHHLLYMAMRILSQLILLSACCVGRGMAGRKQDRLLLIILVITCPTIMS